jgi:hypothetical protein
MIALTFIGIVFAAAAYLFGSVAFAVWVGNKIDNLSLSFGVYFVIAITLVSIPFGVFIQVAS